MSALRSKLAFSLIDVRSYNGPFNVQATRSTAISTCQLSRDGFGSIGRKLHKYFMFAETEMIQQVSVGNYLNVLESGPRSSLSPACVMQAFRRPEAKLLAIIMKTIRG